MKASDRFLTLDAIRGVAVLGILLLNIIAFAMPAPAYYNPVAFGGSTGPDLAAWLINFIFFDGKMRGLFSVLFGASMLLVIDRAEAKGDDPAQVHYARMVWLLVFGLIHLWLIWWGDILSHYALVGMIAYLFRNARVPQMIGLGISLLFVQLALAMAFPMLVLDAQAAPNDAGLAKALTALQQGFGTPGAAWLSEQVSQHRGSWQRIATARYTQMQWAPLSGVLEYGWETLAYMLFGMAGLRSGLLTGEWQRARYVKWMAICLGIALPAYLSLAAWVISQEFSLIAVTIATMPATVPIRPFAVMGWACLIVLLMQPAGALTSRVAAAGRMAFSNYIGTSLICTLLFYGYGPGLYGKLSRSELYLVVAAIWALILLWSKPWLMRFAHGPLEWLWRNLVQGRYQPFRRRLPCNPVANATQ